MATTSPVLAIPVPDPTDADDIPAIVGAVATRLDAAVVSKAGGSTITPSGAGVKGLIVKLVAGQTANGFEQQDSSGAVLLASKPDGSVTARGALFQQVGQPTFTPLSVQGVAGQSGALTRWTDSSGTLLLNVTAVGRVGFSLPLVTAAASSATGGSGLPALAAGFISVEVDGQHRKIPYYLP